MSSSFILNRSESWDLRWATTLPLSEFEPESELNKDVWILLMVKSNISTCSRPKILAGLPKLVEKKVEA